MQTTQTEVSDTKTDRQESVRILLDSGSQRTYITEDVVKRLRLRIGPSEEIMLITFGAEKPQRVKTPQAYLNMKLKDVKSLTISAYVVPKITGTVQRSHIRQTAKEKWLSLIKHLQLADIIPTSFEDARVDIFIGNDYYLNVISNEKIEQKQRMMLAYGLLSITK